MQSQLFLQAEQCPHATTAGIAQYTVRTFAVWPGRNGSDLEAGRCEARVWDWDMRRSRRTSELRGA